MPREHNQEMTEPMAALGSTAIGARWGHLALGICAGAAYWGVVEWGWDRVPDRLAVFGLMCVLIGFGVAGILLSALGIVRAGAVGAVMGAGIGGLVALGMANFDDARGYFHSGHVIVAILVLAAIPVPFALGWLRDGRHFSYRHLFMDSWTIVVRYAAAWAFAGLALLVAFLSSELLAVIGVEFLRELLREEFVSAVLLGGLVGLGLAVVAELNDLISPYLLLRMVRLLTPFVLLVLAVFLAMVPVRGLTALFSGMSTGGNLMAAGLGAVALVSIVVDRDDLDGPSQGILYWSARVMAGLIVVLGGLAAAAVWLRVGQYGWTPERVSAAAVALVVLGYGVAYVWALLRGAQWRAGVRAGNWAMALVLIGMAGLWLNPWITPEAIAVRSQMARLDLEAKAETAPLWEMAHDWGRFGTQAIAALKADAGPQTAALLAQLAAAGNSYEFNENATVDLDRRARLTALIPVLPQGRVLPDAVMRGMMTDRDSKRWEGVCAMQTPQGHPGCLVVFADLIGDAPGEEILMLGLGDLIVRYQTARAPEGTFETSYVWNLPEGMTMAAAIDLFWAQGISLVPSRDQAISLGGQRIAPRLR